MAFDLQFDDEDQELAASVRRFCERHLPWPEAGVTPGGHVSEAVWLGLAAMGVLGLATPDGGGGACSVSASMEVLGEAMAPGPLSATFVATQLLGDRDRKAVADGQALVAFGTPPLLPWAAAANVFVELDGDDAWLARPVGPIVPVETMAGEPWGRVELERVERLGDASMALSLGDIALAAYLVGAGQRLLMLATEYARDRMQFGRSIGEFQAVAHPLVDCRIHLDAARVLVHLAAHRYDQAADVPRVRSAAATARLSAGRAALDTAYRAHQTFGAMGFTIEGPMANSAPRIRQLTLLPPGLASLRSAVVAQLPT